MQYIKLTVLLLLTTGCFGRNVQNSWGSSNNGSVHKGENGDKRWSSVNLMVVNAGNCIIRSMYTIPSIPVEPPYPQRQWFIYSGELYGLSNQLKHWPLTNIQESLHAHVTTLLQPIAERDWLTSSGEYVYVNSEAPLYTAYNEEPMRLDLNSAATDPFHFPAKFLFEITNCKYDNAKNAHMKAVRDDLKKPTDTPDVDIIKTTVLSTTNIKDNNEYNTLQLVDEFLKSGFKGGQIVIEDVWESCIGNLIVDPKKFPNMRSLSNKLRDKGFKVSISISPFIYSQCSVYEEAKSKGYFIKSKSSVYSVGKDETMGIIDVTNTKACAWWIQRLKSFMNENGIDSLKFVGGETDWLPENPILTGDSSLFPNLYTQKYVEFAAKFGKRSQVGVGFRTQEYPLFVRMIEKISSWEALTTLIPSLLQMNMAGYPFVWPVLVGGVGEKTEKELFIRWLQASVFMPVIAFSSLPSDYDDETIEISKKYTDLHSQYADEIFKVMKNAVSDGTPVNPPIWWISPLDKQTYSINDEYLLGEKILVAPVLKKGARLRDIYLPEGEWHDKLRDKVINVPILLKGYQVNLKELPYFVKSSAPTLSAVIGMCITSIIILLQRVL